MRDVWLVARFEVLRAVRTWRALALVVLVSVAMGGGAYLFAQFVGLMENQLATTLGVASTRTPGAMLEQLVTSDSYRDVMGQMFGEGLRRDWVLTLHPSSLYAFGLATLVMPFFAATASSESIAIDVQSRAIRFEALRTGRLELVLGRFAGQLGILTLAIGVATLVAFVVTLMSMIVSSPLSLIGDLLMFAVRSWAFAVPFVGVGIAASQLTASPAWARVLAIGATLGSWMVFAWAPTLFDHPTGAAVVDVVTLALPQRYLVTFVSPGTDWIGSVVIEIGIATVVTVIAFPWFARRNL